MKTKTLILILLGIIININYINYINCADFNFINNNNPAISSHAIASNNNNNNNNIHEEREKEKEKELCSICRDNFGNQHKKVILTCNHELCYDCLVQIDKYHFNALCPFCRAKAKIQDSSPSDDLDIQLAKFDSLNDNNLKQETKEEEEEEICPICYDNFGNQHKKVILTCNHELCYDCLVQIDKYHFNAKCPFCRKIAQIKGLDKDNLNAQLGILASQFENNNIKPEESDYSNYSENLNDMAQQNNNDAWYVSFNDLLETRRRARNRTRAYNEESENWLIYEMERNRARAYNNEEYSNYLQPQPQSYNRPQRQAQPQTQTQVLPVRQRPKNNNIKNLFTGLILGTLTGNVQSNKYEHKNKYYSLIACAGLFDQKDSNDSQVLTFASSFIGGYLLQKLGSKVMNQFKSEEEK